MANWVRLEDPFSNYNVSDEGEVMNAETGRLLTLRFSNRNAPIVSMQAFPSGAPTTRSLALLVAHSFVPVPDALYSVIYNEDLDLYSRVDPPESITPIHLNGYRQDCRADNLAWRTRSYAFHYHKQFESDHNWVRTYHQAELVETGERSWELSDFVTKYGITEQSVLRGLTTGEAVWPHNIHFRFVDA